MRRQPANGTALAAVSSALLIASLLRRDMRFDWRTALAPVLLMTDVPCVVAVRTDSPHNTLPGLLAAAARAEQPLAFASGGVAIVSHPAGELLAQRAGVRVLALGVTPAGGTRRGFATRLAEEAAMWAEVVARTGSPPADHAGGPHRSSRNDVTRRATSRRNARASAPRPAPAR